MTYQQCPNCGKAFSTEYVYCPFCGAPAGPNCAEGATRTFVETGENVPEEHHVKIKGL